MKKILALALVLVMVLSMSAFSWADDEFADLDPVKITLASTYASTDSQVIAANYFKDLVEEKTKGKVTVEIFADGVMGGEADNLEMCSFGELDMLVVGTLCVANYAPTYSFFDAPFVFNSKEHMLACWDGEVGDGMRAQLEDAGLKLVGRMGRGYRYITSNTKVENVEDMKKLTIRTSTAVPYINALSEIGAVVVPLALPELFTSLQMGVVDASEGPMDQIVSYKLYEVQDYIALSGHSYSVSMWIFNKDFFENLPEAYQTVITEAVTEACDYGTQLGADREAELIEEAKAQGVEFNEVDLIPFNEKAAPAVAKMFESDWTSVTPEIIASYDK